jgi:hypothetical protein
LSQIFLTLARTFMLTAPVLAKSARFRKRPLQKLRLTWPPEGGHYNYL